MTKDNKKNCDGKCTVKRLREETKEILMQYKQVKDNLIVILEEIQLKYGYIPKICQEEISEYLGIPMAEIYGVITFYSRFSLEPKGKYKVSVCLGTACFVKGSKDLLVAAENKLGIKEGQTSKDGMFSLDTTRCLGACGLAPVFTINNEVYGKATVKKMNEILDEYMKMK